MNTIDSPDSSRPCIDFLNCALGIAQFNIIANSDRALPHQNPTADEVVNDVLGTETNTDGNRAGNERERSQRNAEQIQRGDKYHDETQNHEPALHHLDKIRVDAAPFHHPAGYSHNPAHQQVANNNEPRNAHDLTERNHDTRN